MFWLTCGSTPCLSTFLHLLLSSSKSKVDCKEVNMICLKWLSFWDWWVSCDDASMLTPSEEDLDGSFYGSLFLPQPASKLLYKMIWVSALEQMKGGQSSLLLATLIFQIMTLALGEDSGPLGFWMIGTSFLGGDLFSLFFRSSRSGSS